jgi:hypothetical protein
VKIKKGVSLIRSLTNPGKSVLAILCAIFASASLLLAADVSVSIDRNKIAPGDTAVISVKVSGADDISPESVPKVDGCSIRYTGVTIAFESINGRSWSGKKLQFAITPKREGTFAIPPIKLNIDGKIYETKTVTVESSKKYQGRSSSPFGFGRMPFNFDPFADEDSGEDVTLKGIIDLPKRSMYVGEALAVRYSVSLSSETELKFRGFEKQPVFDGFIKKEFKRDEALGKKYNFMQYVLVPQAPGNYPIGEGIAVFAGGGSNDNRAEFKKEMITVRELPAAGKPAHFSGNVGSFQLEGELNDIKCAAFDEQRLTVRIKGSGNFYGLKRPEFESVSDGLKVLYDDGEDSLAFEGGTVKGEKNILITIIPEREGVFHTGDLTFNYFDPSIGSYQLRTLKGISLTAGGMRASEAQKAGAVSQSQTSVIVWIIGAFVCAGLFIVWIVVHDRRKYRLAEPAEEEKPVKLEEKKPVRMELYSDVLTISDPEIFLREAEKYISAVDDSPEKEKIKELLFNVKYGGENAFGVALLREEIRKLQKKQM